MSLSISPLGSFPQTGTQVDAPYQTYPYTPTAGTVFVAGFLDGEQKSKLFYVNNTSGAVVPLPTLVSIKQTVSPIDPVGNTKTGGFTVQVLPGSGTGGISPDASSPDTYYLDVDAMIILASTNVG